MIDDDSISSMSPDSLLFGATCLRDEAAVDRALERGANVNGGTASEVSPVFAAIWSIRGASEGLRRIRRGQQLIGHKVPSSDQYWRRELESATRILRRLIDRGADVNVRSPHGNSALHLAATYDIDAECVRILIDAGADLNARNNAGQRPLDVAKRYDSRHTAYLLLCAGADTTGSLKAWIKKIESSSRDRSSIERTR